MPVYAYLRDLKVCRSGFAVVICSCVHLHVSGIVVGGIVVVYTYTPGIVVGFASFDFHIPLPQVPLLEDLMSDHGNDV